MLKYIYIYILFHPLAEKKWWCERNNKERLKKIYIFQWKSKIIEFLDVSCIVKWYGIIDKVAFWDGKIG